MKERLTGAIILVALLVLLVPELLTGPESRTSQPAGADGAQLRSYTIDLKDDANRQPPPPQAPVVTASDDPVGQATPEPEGEAPHAENVIPPADEATRAASKPMGSGADAPAATASEQGPAGGADSAAATVAKSGAAAPASADDERPRSAFGPNARPQPDKSASAAKSGTGTSEGSKSTAAKADTLKAQAAKADAAKAEAAKADAKKAEVAKAEAAKADAARAEAVRADARKAEAAKAEAAKAEAARLAAAKAESAKDATRLAATRSDSAKSQSSARPDAAKPGAKGWAVQLGVFGSRDNAERLAKQVKGSGFPVLINETSGKDGKKLYWVRVGPEAEQASATALSAKLKAAGHRDARVVAYP